MLKLIHAPAESRCPETRQGHAVTDCCMQQSWRLFFIFANIAAAECLIFYELAKVFDQKRALMHEY